MAYFRRGALIERFTQTVTSGGVLTLLNNSTTAQVIVGALDHTITLPDATTCDGSSAVGGQKFHIINDSLGIVTVNKNGGALLCKLAPNKDVTLWLVNNSSAAGEWKVLEFLGNQPLHFSASLTPDSKIYIAANSVPNTDGTDTNTPPASSQIPSVPLSSHDLQTGVTSGASFSGAAAPTSTVGQYRRVGYTLLPSGVIQVLWSAESATIGGLANAGTVFAKKGQAIGWMEVVADGATSFRTAGSSSGIIENNVGGLSLVHRFGSGGGGGSGTGDANSFLEDIKNRLRDSFFEFATPNIFSQQEQTLIDAGSTGSYNIANSEYDLSTSQTLISKQMYGSSFLASSDESMQAEIMALFGTLPTTHTVQISKDGGANYETVSMSQVGSSKVFRGVHVIANPPGTVQYEYSNSNADNNTELNNVTRQAYAMKLAQVPVGTKKRILSGNIYVNKTGTPLGHIYVKVVRDNGGVPGTEVVGQNATTIDIASLSAGLNTISFNISAILTAGTYWIVVETSSAYKASFLTAVTSIQLRSDITSPTYPEGMSYEYDGTNWAANVLAYGVFQLSGYTYDLRVKVTATAGSGSLAGYGILYGENAPQNYQQEPLVQRFDFDGGLNTTEFTITKFVPSALRLRVYDVKSGQVYRFPAFALDGRKVIFASGQFFNPGETITLLFDQAEQGEFDNSDVNGSLLASNHLGSSDGTFDRSVAGRGVVLRRPDGTLREVVLDNFDNIVILTVP